LKQRLRTIRRTPMDPEHPGDANRAVAMVNMLFSALALVLSSIVIITIVRSPRLHTRRHALVLVQSGVDLWISFWGIASGSLIVHFGRWPGGRALCNFSGVWLHLCSGMTLFSLSVIAFERKQAICNRNNIPARRLLMIYSVLFLVSALVAACPFAGLGAYVLQPAGVFCYGETVLSAFMILAVLILGGANCVIVHSYASVALTIRRSRLAVSQSLSDKQV
jgi:hypothetical protein